MKKNIFGKMIAAVALLAAVSLMSGCVVNEDNALWWSDIQSIQGAGVSNHAVTLELGQTVQLTASPSDRGLDWESSNDAVATVSAGGLVTAIGLGEAYITVYPKVYEGVANGNYIVVTVVDKSVGYVDDAIDQAEAQ